LGTTHRRSWAGRDSCVRQLGSQALLFAPQRVRINSQDTVCNRYPRGISIPPAHNRSPCVVIVQCTADGLGVPTPPCVVGGGGGILLLLLLFPSPLIYSYSNIRLSQGVSLKPDEIEGGPLVLLLGVQRAGTNHFIPHLPPAGSSASSASSLPIGPGWSGHNRTRRRVTDAHLWTRLINMCVQRPHLPMSPHFRSTLALAGPEPGQYVRCNITRSSHGSPTSCACLCDADPTTTKSAGVLSSVPRQTTGSRTPPYLELKRRVCSS